MKNALELWDHLQKEIKKKNLFLFLDYDGTLTPIAKTPKKAKLPAETRKVLERLSRIPSIKLAIISGRKTDDVKRQVGLSRIIYAGNHGLEIKAPGIKFPCLVSGRMKAMIAKIGKELKTRLKGIDGVLVEDKGLTLSVHYRLVKKNSEINKLKTIFKDVLPQYLLERKIKISEGKKVFELKPSIEWDKGKAVEWLLKKMRADAAGKPLLPIYIGDDTTDENAFKVLRRKGLSIAVGKSSGSSASYFLDNTNEVMKFLIQLAKIK